MAKKKEIIEVEKLRSFKERSGWSYRKIGSHMAIHQQTIYFWLSGQHEPSQLALERVRRFLDAYVY